MGVSAVLRLPRKREVRRLVYLRLRGKRRRGPAAAPRCSSARKLCVLRLPRQREVRRRCEPEAATAPQLRHEALCTAPATQKGNVEALCSA